MVAGVSMHSSRNKLDLIKIEPDTPLEVSTDDGKRLIVTPIAGVNKHRAVRDALEWTNKTHAKTLKRLAK